MPDRKKVAEVEDSNSLLVVHENTPLTWLAIGGLLVLILMLGGLGAVGVAANSERITDQQHRDASAGEQRDLATCNYGNVGRAFQFIDNEGPEDTPTERRLVGRAFFIVNCKVFVRSGDRVAVPAPEAKRYINLVRDRKLPKLDVRGHVTGADPLAAQVLYPGDHGPEIRERAP